MLFYVFFHPIHTSLFEIFSYLSGTTKIGVIASIFLPDNFCSTMVHLFLLTSSASASSPSPYNLLSFCAFFFVFSMSLLSLGFIWVGSCYFFPQTKNPIYFGFRFNSFFCSQYFFQGTGEWRKQRTGWLIKEK